ncbi:MAG: type II toxin-antitoxin system VapC family toxin [Verrucomicrobiia bacterium]|jgi:PIN domain nuclease of toxin-antitoxin system
MILDTHVLLWWLTDEEQLSPRAREFMDACVAGQDRCVLCGVSLWELELKRRGGKLLLADSVRSWIPRLQQLEFMELTGVSFELWMDTAELNWAHRDPADRLIAATALQWGVPVLTRDRRFHAEDSPVDAVW